MNVIENLWLEYLKKVGIEDENVLPPVQRSEMKKTFFGAVGSLLIYQRDIVGEMSEEEGAAVLSSIMKEVSDFFKSQTEIETLEFDERDIKELKKSYKIAVDAKATSFKFKGKNLLTDYAKYLIEYLEKKTKKQTT